MKRFFATLTLTLMLGGLSAPVFAGNDNDPKPDCNPANSMCKDRGVSSVPAGDTLPLL